MKVDPKPNEQYYLITLTLESILIKKVESLSFENALDELETLVERLESGEQSLEESLKEFERGIQLTRHCQKSLQSAEQRVEKLIKQNQMDLLVPFEDGEAQ